MVAPQPVKSRVRLWALVLLFLPGIMVAADLTIVDTTTVPGLTPSLETRTSGEAIKAGQPVYLKATDHLIYLSQSSLTVVEAATIGIAVNNCAMGQPITYQKSGDLTLGTTMTTGVSYVVSANKGMIAPAADLVGGNYITILGNAKSATVLTVHITATGAQR